MIVLAVISVRHLDKQTPIWLTVLVYLQVVANQQVFSYVSDFNNLPQLYVVLVQ